MLNSTECCTREQILRECHVFVREMGISESSFGRNAVNDGSLIARLRAGKDINTKKLDRLRTYMAHERTRRAEAGARRATACQEGACLSEAEAEDHEGALEGAPGWCARFLLWFEGWLP
jgi:hypothetical protein